MELQNRFVRSATHEFMAEEDGTPLPDLETSMKSLQKMKLD
jgi:2,4-dienoyl-CoA reductase-like NADH-dependent reductase (Old Yellow Enzyme family)